MIDISIGPVGGQLSQFNKYFSKWQNIWKENNYLTLKWWLFLSVTSELNVLPFTEGFDITRPFPHSSKKVLSSENDCLCLLTLRNILSLSTLTVQKLGKMLPSSVCQKHSTLCWRKKVHSTGSLPVASSPSSLTLRGSTDLYWLLLAGWADKWCWWGEGTFGGVKHFTQR